MFGVGVYLHFSAPRNSLLWMLLVLLLAFAAQQTAANFFGKPVSGFFGMLLATPLGYLIHLRFKGPPAMVTFLPSFWLLVPGALSLSSVKQMLSDRAAGIDSLMTAVFVFVSIALGTLMGASLYKVADRVVRRVAAADRPRRTLLPSGAKAVTPRSLSTLRRLCQFRSAERRSKQEPQAEQQDQQLRKESKN